MYHKYNKKNIYVIIKTSLLGIIIIIIIRTQKKMTKILLLLSLILAAAYASPVVDNGTDVWNITLQVEEVARGTGYGFLVGMGLKEAATCFKEMDIMIRLLKELKRLVDNHISDFKSIAKLVNDFAQWFSAEWYACGALKDFGPEFRKYIEKIQENFGGYIGKVIVGFLTDFFRNLNQSYWFIYHHSREEYFDAGNVLGSFLYNRFFLIVK